MKRLRSKVGDWLRVLNVQDKVMQFAKSRQLWDRWESPPELMALPHGQHMLVLAPHMDDEVIGCGGTVRKWVLAGKQVTVAYMTDGRFGDDRLALVSGDEYAALQQQLIATRKQEALHACQILGVTESCFFEAMDAHLQSTAELQDQLRQLLDRVKPDVVFTPFFTEDHKDHRATTALLLDATQGHGYDFECYCYEVWTPLFPNCLIDISQTMACKREALQAHASQLRGIDYLRAMEALSTYRAMRISRDGYGEAFWRVPLAQLRRVYTQATA